MTIDTATVPALRSDDAPAHGIAFGEAVRVWARIAAALAIFRFRIGMIPVLAGCATAGILLRLATP